MPLNRVKKEVEYLLKLRTGSLNRRVQNFMDGVTEPHSLIHRFEPYKQFDAAISAKSFFEKLGAELTHFVGDASDLLDNEKYHNERDTASLFVERFELDNGEARYGLGSCLALLKYRGSPMIVHSWLDNGYNVKVLSGSDENIESFIQEFVEYEEKNCVLTIEIRARVENSLNKRIRTHLGNLTNPEVVTRSYPAFQIPNISLMVVDYFKEMDGEFYGFQMREFERIEPLDFIKEPFIDYGGQLRGIDIINPVYKKYEIALDDVRKGLSKGVILFKLKETPMFAICHETDRYEKEYTISIIGPTVHEATTVLDLLDTYEKDHNIYRGNILRPIYNPRFLDPGAEILKLSKVDWDDVILPEKMKDTIQTQVIEFSEYLDTLASQDIDIKRGLLFHGLPGTGKTLICRLLASKLKGFTTIVASGNSLFMPVEIFKLARKLAPALVVFEDVDLIGTKREESSTRVVLGDLLNELDGIQKSETIFTVLTTNHLDYIEEALVQRPGRIDIILEFPLPGPDLRLKLMELYSGKANLRLEDPSPILERTDGATPAFLQEMMKQSVFRAIRENKGKTGKKRQKKLKITDHHIISTLDSLSDLEQDSRLRKIIGFG